MTSRKRIVEKPGTLPGKAGLPGEGRVLQPGDAEDGLVDSVAALAAVVEDLVGLHSGEGVFDAGSGPAVKGPCLLAADTRDTGS